MVPNETQQICQQSPAMDQTTTRQTALQNDPHHTTAAAPLLRPEVESIETAVDRAARLAAKRVSRQLRVGLVLFVPEVVAAFLAGMAMRDLGRVRKLPDEPHIAMWVVRFLGFEMF